MTSPHRTHAHLEASPTASSELGQHAEGIVMQEFRCSSTVAAELIAWRAAVDHLDVANTSSQIVDGGALVRLKQRYSTAA
jgi:hypothetical protein